MSGAKHSSDGLVYKRAMEVIEAGIGSDLVAMDVEGGECFGFNAVAASAWRALETPKRFDELRDALLEEYDVGADQCSAELEELLRDMVASGLVRAERA